MKLMRTVLSAVACLLLMQGQALAADEKRAVKDIVLPGDAKCVKCHDETEAYPVLSMATTKHGMAKDGRLPSCVGCHGPSETHTNKPEGMKDRPKPEFPYGKRTKDDIAGHNQVCADCHKGGRKFMDWAGSAHAARDVPCTDCHKLHIQKDPVRDKRTQADVCYTCHKEQRVLFNKPSHHPVPEAKMACSDCHASHGSSGPKLVQRDTIADTCFSCHMEKRGPFVRKHEPAEDCTICHNPHGSAVDALLKVRAPMLCQQCHEPGHYGGFPGFTNGASGPLGGNTAGTRGITQARSCLNCHTNIHGTNNPYDATNERTFRR